MTDSVAQLEGLIKEYPSGVGTVRILHGIDLELRAGELTALVGPSGCGKSTLLNLVGLLDKPTAGLVRLGGVEVNSGTSDAELTRLRNRFLGFVFQFHHLIPALSVEENVMLPAAVQSGGFSSAHRQRAQSLLQQMGMRDVASRLPSQLSGGMQQRVAIARALMNAPKLVLADEPTGNLDSETATLVFDELRRHNSDGVAFLIVTHDPSIAARCRRVVRMLDGRIVTIGSMT